MHQEAGNVYTKSLLHNKAQLVYTNIITLPGVPVIKILGLVRLLPAAAISTGDKHAPRVI